MPARCAASAQPQSRPKSPSESRFTQAGAAATIRPPRRRTTWRPAHPASGDAAPDCSRASSQAWVANGVAASGSWARSRSQAVAGISDTAPCTWGSSGAGRLAPSARGAASPSGGGTPGVISRAGGRASGSGAPGGGRPGAPARLPAGPDLCEPAPHGDARESLPRSPGPVTAPFERRFTVRWADVDANGHLRNTAYSELCSDTRIALLAAGGYGWERFRAEGFGPVLLRESLEYLREGKMGEIV